LDRFVLVAHSGGVGVALALGAEHPERVAGLLMVDPATDPRALPPEVREGFVADLAGPGSLDAQKAYFASLAGPDAAVRERVLSNVEAVAPAARLGVGEALAEWDPEPALDAFPAPMRIVATEVTDGPTALWHLRPSIPHVVVGGTGHWLQIERPDLVADEVERFAAALARETTSP
jgi:pimeloyl-ACP methyl ester carboxylesterase